MGFYKALIFNYDRCDIHSFLTQMPSFLQRGSIMALSKFDDASCVDLTQSSLISALKWFSRVVDPNSRRKLLFICIGKPPDNERNIIQHTILNMMPPCYEITCLFANGTVHDLKPQFRYEDTIIKEAKPKHYMSKFILFECDVQQAILLLDVSAQKTLKYIRSNLKTQNLKISASMPLRDDDIIFDMISEYSI